MRGNVVCRSKWSMKSTMMFVYTWGRPNPLMPQSPMPLGTSIDAFHGSHGSVMFGYLHGGIMNIAYTKNFISALALIGMLVLSAMCIV